MSINYNLSQLTYAAAIGDNIETAQSLAIVINNAGSFDEETLDSAAQAFFAVFPTIASSRKDAIGNGYDSSWSV
jgi:hypothetical protein